MPEYDVSAREKQMRNQPKGFATGTNGPPQADWCAKVAKNFMGESLDKKMLIPGSQRFGATVVSGQMANLVHGLLRVLVVGKSV